MSNKINKEFKISYIVSWIILIVYLIIAIFNIIQRKLVLNLFITLISVGPLICFYLSVILTIIFGIINFKRNNNNIVRKKIIIMLITIIGFSILFQTIPSVIKRQLKINTEQKVNIAVKSITEKIKNDSENKYVYFLTDIQELDENFTTSPFGNAYLSSSYIQNFNNEIYVCLSDGKNIISGNTNDLSIGIVNKINTCNFEFSSVEESEYLKGYLDKKYDFDIQNVTCENKYLGFTSWRECLAQTSIGEFDVEAVVFDNSITIDKEYKIEIGIIADFTKKYFNIADLSSSDYFKIEINNLDEKIIEISSYDENEDILVYADALAKYLQKYENKMHVKVIKYPKISDERPTIEDGELITSFILENNKVTWR